MTRTSNQQQPLTLDPQVDEDRVRRALGLKTNSTHTTHQQRPEQARQRHRFVSDGAVPVVMLNRVDGETGGLKEKLALAEAAIEVERAAHAATRRALQEAQAAHQALQTRLGHAELAHNEAMASEREARRAAEEALAAARAEPAETPRRAPRKAASVPQPEPEPEAQPVARKPRVARAPKPEKEQKPVRWWTPSFRAKRKG